MSAVVVFQLVVDRFIATAFKLASSFKASTGVASLVVCISPLSRSAVNLGSILKSVQAVPGLRTTIAEH